MAQSQIIITGNVGADPTRFGPEGGTPACSFRLASTRSFWNRRTNAWQETTTTWITVKAFRTLALNVMQSLHKGDAVIVSGTLATEEWERDGMTRTNLVIEASTAGHDLTKGRSMFVRNPGNGGYQSGDGGWPNPRNGEGNGPDGAIAPNGSPNAGNGGGRIGVDPFNNQTMGDGNEEFNGFEGNGGWPNQSEGQSGGRPYPPQPQPQPQTQPQIQPQPQPQPGLPQVDAVPGPEPVSA